MMKMREREWNLRKETKEKSAQGSPLGRCCWMLMLLMLMLRLMAWRGAGRQRWADSETVLTGAAIAQFPWAVSAGGLLGGGLGRSRARRGRPRSIARRALFWSIFAFCCGSASTMSTLSMMSTPSASLRPPFLQRMEGRRQVGEIGPKSGPSASFDEVSASFPLLRSAPFPAAHRPLLRSLFRRIPMW